MIKKVLRKLILKALPVKVIRELLAAERIAECEKQVMLGEGSRFYEEAGVANFRNEKTAIRIGQNSHIRGELITFGFGGEILIGDHTFVGTGSTIRSAEKITIGNHVLIAHNCTIIDTDSHELNYLERAETFQNMLKKGHSKEKGNVLTGPIVIEDHAWISYNVSILKGVTIGKGAIVGAGSIVTKDVEAFTIVAGNPAKFIKNVD